MEAKPFGNTPLQNMIFTRLHTVPAFRCFLACWILGVSAFLAGCSDNAGNAPADQKRRAGREPVEIVYVDWASEKASSHVVQAVVEQRLGRRCELLPVSLIAMWEAIAAGDQDATVAAWLPSLQARFLQRHRSDVLNLGPNLKGTRIGLVVPEYVNIDSIEGLRRRGGKFANKIIGIDPYAGIMEKTAAAMEAYGLDKFDLVSGSGTTMCTALERAVAKHDWVVVTGWTPHWMFARWDLKYLADPKNIYGGEEHISTVVRKGLRQDMPEVYAFLANFYWSPRDMAEVMLLAQSEARTYRKAAAQWVKENPSIVDTWTGQ
ncbi:MAG TPA: glycine betaine ABC transporter substrate-binding protein [Desulfosalsimonadaceae bacterium]|nr:glycine betaine ABC transporter substrate-binding protein [Desulfosalsimonadaceae bacterium]